MQTIKLDLSMKGIIPILYAKQGDVGRKFKVIITEDGSRYPIPEKVAVSVWYSGASGEGNYTDIGAESAVSVSENEIIVELITQMLTNHGAGVLCLVMNTADGDELGTWNIPYCVEPRPGMNSEAAQAYFTAFSNAVQNLPYPDASLTIAGKAADAAATGAALAGKAPSGYGLGAIIGTIPANSMATFKFSAVRYNVMFSLCGQGGISYANFLFFGYGPGGPSRSQVKRIRGSEHILYGITPQGESPGVTIWNHTGAQLEVNVLSMVGGLPTMTVGSDGGATAEPYEWENPPMALGVEYRTTERWDGRPVYTKAWNIGRVESGTTTIEHGISIRQPLDIKLYGNAAVDLTGSNLITNLSTDRTIISLVTTSAFGSCDVVIKYTKL